jgi:hypothetical protein
MRFSTISLYLIFVSDILTTRTDSRSLPHTSHSHSSLCDTYKSQSFMQRPYTYLLRPKYIRSVLLSIISSSRSFLKMRDRVQHQYEIDDKMFYIFVYICKTFCHLFRVYIYIYCTMLRSLTTSDHQLYRVTPLKPPFRLVIPLLQSSRS